MFFCQNHFLSFICGSLWSSARSELPKSFAQTIVSNECLPCEAVGQNLYVSVTGDNGRFRPPDPISQLHQVSPDKTFQVSVCLWRIAGAAVRGIPIKDQEGFSRPVATGEFALPAERLNGYFSWLLRPRCRTCIQLHSALLSDFRKGAGGEFAGAANDRKVPHQRHSCRSRCAKHERPVWGCCKAAPDKGRLAALGRSRLRS